MVRKNDRFRYLVYEKNAAVLWEKYQLLFYLFIIIINNVPHFRGIFFAIL